MYVDCQIDGNAELCMVDTGAEYSQVSDQISGVNRYASLGSIFNIGLSTSAPVQSDFVEVQNFAMLGISLGAEKVLREGQLAFPEYLSKSGVEGVVGNDIFSSYEVFFDFVRKEMHFEEPIPSALVQHDLNVLPSHHVVMKAILNGDSVNGLWDTGSHLTVVDQDYVSAHSSDFTYLQDLSDQADAAGRPLSVKLYRTKSLSIEDLSFSDVPVAVTSLQNTRGILGGVPVQMLIGYNILSQANWYLDFPNKHWSAEKH